MENKKRNSILLISIIFIISIISLLLAFASKADSTKVLITIDGVKYGEYSLVKDQIIEINLNGDINVVKIENKTVEVVKANCDNQICVNSYPISLDYPNLIVCLPHGLIIELTK